MKLYLAFLIGSFIVGATDMGRPLRRHPALFFVGCIMVGSLFYSYRFIR